MSPREQSLAKNRGVLQAGGRQTIGNRYRIGDGSLSKQRFRSAFGNVLQIGFRTFLVSGSAGTLIHAPAQPAAWKGREQGPSGGNNMSITAACKQLPGAIRR